MTVNTQTRPAVKRVTDQNIKTQRRGPGGKLLPKIVDTPIKVVLDALNEALKSIRDKHPEIPNVVLVVGHSDIRRHGHFAPKSWESKGAQHEIALSGESLRRGAEAVLGTLIHECAHALAESRGIKDTSRQGRFHNKRFKLLAEEMGIIVGYTDPETGKLVPDKGIGWSPTTLPKETAQLYKPELAALRTALKSYRIPIVKSPNRARNTTKIECDCRSVTVPNSFLAKGDLTCDACGVTFEESQS